MEPLRIITGLVVAASLTTTAQTLQWAGKLGGPGATYASAVAVDAAGNTLTTGWFDHTSDMDPGPGVANLTVPVGGDFDIHVTKLDAMGGFIWTRQMGGDGYDYARAIAVDAAGNVYVAGKRAPVSCSIPLAATSNKKTTRSDKPPIPVCCRWMPTKR